MSTLNVVNVVRSLRESGYYCASCGGCDVTFSIDSMGPHDGDGFPVEHMECGSCGVKWGARLRHSSLDYIVDSDGNRLALPQTTLYDCLFASGRRPQHSHLIPLISSVVETITSKMRGGVSPVRGGTEALLNSVASELLQALREELKASSAFTRLVGEMEKLTDETS